MLFISIRLSDEDNVAKISICLSSHLSSALPLKTEVFKQSWLLHSQKESDMITLWT